MRIFERVDNRREARSVLNGCKPGFHVRRVKNLQCETGEHLAFFEQLDREAASSRSLGGFAGSGY